MFFFCLYQCYLIFPSLLKKAIVIPAYKSGDKKDSNNYRPISLLHDFSKIFERNLYNKMYDYIDKLDNFHDDQYVFLKDISTSHALIDQVQYLINNIDSINIVFSSFLDFRKASDIHDLSLSSLILIIFVSLSKLFFLWLKENST